MIVIMLVGHVIASLLEGVERLGKRPHELAPSGHRGARVFGPHQRDAGATRNDEFWWDFQAARFRAELDLFRRAHGLGENVVAGKAEARSAAIAAFSSRQWRSARPAESA